VLGEQVVPNSSASWHRAMDWLRPGGAHGVRAAARRARERVRQRAGRPRRDYSTFALVRDAGPAAARACGGAAAGRRRRARDAGARRRERRLRWATQVDAAALDQVLGLWREATPPR
jgi:hypothetical protein